jgi:hypothetical protein
MAKAPTPGVGKRKEAAAKALHVLRVTVNGETKSLHINNLPFGELAAVRKTSGGLPLAAFWGGPDTVIDTDSLKVLWWLARRADGEPRLPMSAVDADWDEVVNTGDFDVKYDDGAPEEDDPEA